MADAKVTSLTSLAAPSLDDILYVVDDPAGTPISKKATIEATLAARTSGYAFIRNDGSTTQSIAATTDAKISTPLTTVVSNADGWWDTSNKKYLPLKAGKYVVIGTVSFSNQAGSADVIASLRLNGTELVRGSRVRNSTGGATCAQVSGIVTFNGSTDYVELYLYNGDSSSQSTEAYNASTQFFAHYLGA